MSICLMPFCKYRRQLKAMAAGYSPNSELRASARDDSILIVIKPASGQEFENIRYALAQMSLPVKHHLLNYKNTSPQFREIVNHEYKTIYRPKPKREKSPAPAFD